MKKAILAAIILLSVSRGFCAELLVFSQHPITQAVTDAVSNLDTIIVTPYPTIQSAIDAASNGDTVVVMPGRYEGDGNRDISFGGKAITVRSVDPNDQWVVDNTVIDCNEEDFFGFIFNLGEDANSVLDGLTTTNAGGSAVYCHESSPTIRNCNIIGNNSIGIRCDGDGRPTIVNCRVKENADVGILCLGPATINNCTIVNNQARGIYASGASVEISDSIIIANFAQGDGGGLYSYYRSAKAQRCTFVDNTAGGSGGGAYGGSFTNCIFWGNSDAGGTGAAAQIASEAAVFFSCIQDDDPNDAEIPFGGEENGNIDDDPMFVREPNDGGDGWGVGDNDDYGDLHLKIDSPCIDAGSPLYNGLNETDIDGQPRVIGSAVDMGADEYDKIIVVTRPVAGEVWATGSKRQIKWSGYGVGSVDILLSSDNGENWETIAADITDANNYLWQLPGDVDSNQCLISVLPSDGDPNVICLPSGLFTVSWYPEQPAVPPEWQHRGLLPAPDLSQNKGPELGCVKWVFDTNGPVSSQVAVTRPYWNSYGVYIGCEDGNIYALDDLGELIWSCDINTQIVGSPAVGYYWMVYVAGQDGWLYAIDDYGDIRWTQTTNAPVYSTPVVGYSGKIYVCSEDGFVYAFDADGSELWTFETAGPGKVKGTILATPVIERNGAVYVAGLYDPNLYALDANSGSVKWVCHFASAYDPNNTQGRHIFASPAINPDGTIYQTLVGDSNLYAIDPCTGAIIWSTLLRPDPDYYHCASEEGEYCRWIINEYLTAIRNHSEIPSWLLEEYQTTCDEGRWHGISALMWGYYYDGSSGWSSPAVGPDGTIYVSFDDPYLRAVEPNGTIKWITRLGMVGGFTVSIDRNGLIYAASDDSYVCVVNADGVEVSRFKGIGWVSFPAITEDGTLIVSDSNNRVWAITDTPCESQQPVLHWLADVQPNWKVDFMDFAMLANNWLECTNPDDVACISGYGMYAPSDINRNMYVDFADFAAMADKWLMEAN